MISIPDSIVKWLPDLSRNELKIYLVINRYITEQEPLPLEKFFEVTEAYNYHKVNAAIASLIEKEVISFKLSENGEAPRKARWLDTEKRLDGYQKKLVKKIAIEELSDNTALEDRANHGYYFEDLLTGNKTKVFLVLGKQKSKIKITRKKRTKKKKNKNKNKKKYIYILYKEINDILKASKGNKQIANNLISYKRETQLDLSRNQFFLVSLLENKVNPELKADYSVTIEGLSQFFKLATDKIRKRQANQLVSYMADKLFSISDGGIKLSNQWVTYQRASAKRLLKENPSIPFDEWFDIMDFFFEDDFWCDKISTFLALEKHLHRYQMAKSKKKPSSKKAKSRLSKQKIIK